jgi:MoaA/NifB/PqqE/SkfB family radical SAM enzyme
MTSTMLRSLFLKPTLACTARCSHCESRMEFYRSLGRERLTLADHRRIIAEARQLGARALHLSGGEPTLYADLPELVRAGRRAGMFAILNTNGSRITDVLAAELLEAGLGAVILSLHSATSPLHDRIKRRPGSFDEVLQSVRCFANARRESRARFLITTQTIVTRQNYRELEAIVDLVCGLQVDAHGISYLEGDSAGESLLGLDEIRELRDVVLPAVVRRLERHAFRSPVLRFAALRLVRRLYSGDTRQQQHLAAGRFRGEAARRRCHTPSVFAMVLADGSVLPCNMAEYAHGPILGNARQESLGAILTSERWRRFAREGFALCPSCPSHLHFHVPVSVGLGSLLGFARRNPAEEQKSIAGRMAEALGVAR